MVITHEHVVSFLTGSACLFALLKVIAPMTQTTKDDALVEGVSRAKSWIEQKAPVVWGLVEVAAKTGSLPAGVGKAIYFVEILRKAYAEAHQKDLPRDIEAVAMKIANEMSRSEKTIAK